MSGAVPAQLGNLSRLESLSLSHNELTGAIPPQLGKLSNLTGLLITHNQLSGSIPVQLAALNKLEHLYLSNNVLTGAIPSQLRSLTALTYLTLSHNALSGSIPKELGNLTKLEHLHLENNSLTGAIPSELGSLTALEYLYLAHNQLSGCIPEALRSVGDSDLASLGLPYCGTPVPPSPTATPRTSNLKKPTATPTATATHTPSPPPTIAPPTAIATHAPSPPPTIAPPTAIATHAPTAAPPPAIRVPRPAPTAAPPPAIRVPAPAAHLKSQAPPPVQIQTQTQTQTQPQAQDPFAITLPSMLNVHSGPDLLFNVVTTMPIGSLGRILGIAPDDDWYQVQFPCVDGTVWLEQDQATLVGSLAGVRIFTAQDIALLPGAPGMDDGVPLAITVPITMSVQSGPGLDYDEVSIVPAGTQGRILGLDPTDDWFQVELEGLDMLGWLLQDGTTVFGSLAGVRRLTTQEIALLPAAISQPPILNVRSGPGLDYDVVTTVPQGTWARVTGIDADNEWFQVELDGLDQPAWLFRDLTKVAGGSLAGLFHIVAAGSELPVAYQNLVNSITVELALRQPGGADLEVSWTDADTCTQPYNLYHRAGADTTTYISLETAVTGSTANAKSLSFSLLSGRSFISAWCGTLSGGRVVAEVEIIPDVAGVYRWAQPTNEGLAVAPSR